MMDEFDEKSKDTCIVYAFISSFEKIIFDVIMDVRDARETWDI